MARTKRGRPRRYSNIGQLQAKIDAYFDACHIQGSIPTKAGLCYHLGFADPAALSYYTDRCKARNHFSKAIRMALLRVEAAKAQALVDGNLDAGRLRGLCFDLRCNHGWKENVAGEVKGQEVQGIAVVGWSRWGMHPGFALPVLPVQALRVNSVQSFAGLNAQAVLSPQGGGFLLPPAGKQKNGAGNERSIYAWGQLFRRSGQVLFIVRSKAFETVLILPPLRLLKTSSEGAFPVLGCLFSISIVSGVKKACRSRPPLGSRTRSCSRSKSTSAHCKLKISPALKPVRKDKSAMS